MPPNRQNGSACLTATTIQACKQVSMIPLKPVDNDISQTYLFLLNINNPQGIILLRRLKREVRYVY